MRQTQEREGVRQLTTRHVLWNRNKHRRHQQGVVGLRVGLHATDKKPERDQQKSMRQNYNPLVMVEE
jgi:hypothetical protein